MTHTLAVDVHLPCPPLREWLPMLLANKRVAAWDPSRAPRRVRSVLREWPPLDDKGDENDASDPADLDALLFGVSLERPAPPEAWLARLRSNTMIIELAVPRRRVVRGLIGLGPRAQTQAAASQSRTLQWLARGCFALEQWEAVDPPGVVVTLARIRR